MANENCEFVNQCGYSKNCYLSFNCDYSEDCFYCTNVIRSKNCLDLLNAEQCELCCESMDIHTCYNVARSRNCKNSSDLRHCQNLQACRHCFGCINLRNREYCFLNEQCSREEYERHIEPYCRGEWSKEREMEQMFAEHALRFPRKHLEMLQCERSLGDNLTNCKNTYQCFDSFKNEDIAYCTITSNCKDSQDGDTGGYDCELCYEMISSGMNNQRCLFGSNYWGGCDGALYCEVVKDCRDCFGCICLRNARYCILNKQCTKEEYDAIAPKMIDHMRRTGEWGEFHPIESSPFAYNESVAMDYVPLTKEEVLKHAWMWRDRSDEKLKVERMIPCHALPDSIADIPDDIFNWAIQCEATKRPFRIIKQELDFYRSQNLTIPHLHPDERHRLRMLMRNPRKLWKRVCAKCAKEIQTSYSPDRPEIVYCEECYLATVC
ncbi:hypothetical protein HY213_04130 [Candidatus Peregrinibacteria bacterium]|nr:hypothetical protein [Candidatus Peregrinibacteria bacterium]